LSVWGWERRIKEERKGKKKLFLSLVHPHKAAIAVSSRSFPMTLWGEQEEKKYKELTPGRLLLFHT
jgi:hypothetical protein